MHSSYSRTTRSLKPASTSCIGWWNALSRWTELVRKASSPLANYIGRRRNWTGTGEHGVGLGKRKYLIDELGEGTVELMKTIKRTIDPYNLFNPGKVS